MLRLNRIKRKAISIPGKLDAWIPGSLMTWCSKVSAVKFRIPHFTFPKRFSSFCSFIWFKLKVRSSTTSFCGTIISFTWKLTVGKSLTLLCLIHAAYVYLFLLYEVQRNLRQTASPKMPLHSRFLRVDAHLSVNLGNPLRQTAKLQWLEH